MRIKTVLLAFCLFWLIPIISKSQENIDLTLGAAIPEGFHLGSRFHYSTNSRIDLRIGSDLLFADQKQYIFFGLNHAVYFGKINEKADRKLWTFNTGLTFLFSNSSHREASAQLLKVYFAREIPVTKNILIEPELGINYLLHENSRIKDGLYEGYLLRFLPVAGVNIVFHF
jgi:hypothetical protein